MIKMLQLDLTLDKFNKIIYRKIYLILMDTFKIICIIFMIIVIYQIYQINCVVFKDKFEGFEGTAQSLGGVDDTNAINTLAQIAKNLMAGGVTVPGNMRVQGDISTGEGKVSINNGTINLQSDGGGGLYFVKRGNPGKVEEWNRLHTGDVTVNGNLNGGGSIRGNFAEDQENGLKFPYGTWMKTARTDGGQDPYKMLFQNDGKTIFRSHAGYEFRNPKDQQLAAIDGNGILYVQGRNILAELDQCIKNGNVIFNQRTQDGKFVWGDGVGHPDSGWSRWVIRKA